MYTSEPQIIPLLSPADYQSVGSDLDSINMGRLHKVKVILMTGVVTGDNPTVQCYAGATAGVKTTELPFKIRKANADILSASADVFGARTSVAAGGSGHALGVAAAADVRTWTIDLMSDEMPEGKPWLTIFVDDGSASVLFMTAVAIGWPREAGDTHQTAL
jgi:hypothetical protein